MFGFDQEKLMKKMQIAIEESKIRLENSTVIGDAGGGLITIEMNGNKKIKSVSIHTELSMIDKEDLEDLLTVSLAKALEKAEEINQLEMSKSTSPFLPNF